MLDDTIAAIATPLGEGGLAVIRISGRDALVVADRVFQPGNKASHSVAEAATHTVHYGHIVRDGQHVGVSSRGEGVGEIALVMDSPRTATVTARTDADLYTLDREPFVFALTGHPSGRRSAACRALARQRPRAGCARPSRNCLAGGTVLPARQAGQSVRWRTQRPEFMSLA